MKKIITLLFIFTLFLVGCEDKKENGTLTLKVGSYYDKNNMHNGSSLEWINFKDTEVVEKTVCGADAGCSLFKGTYEISGPLLKITINEYNEIEGWVKLDKEELSTYTITANNEFTKDNSVFILKDAKSEDKITKHEVNLEKENEKFEFGKLNLEFTGSVYEECGKDCYLYTLNTKYDGKEVGKGFFNDEENLRIFSKNMSASFTVYIIDGVYILVSGSGAQCFPNNILIFNTKGETLKMFADADINFNGKNITIERSNGSCMEEGTKYNFEVSGTELKEK